MHIDAYKYMRLSTYLVHHADTNACNYLIHHADTSVCCIT